MTITQIASTTQTGEGFHRWTRWLGKVAADRRQYVKGDGNGVGVVICDLWGTKVQGSLLGQWFITFNIDEITTLIGHLNVLSSRQMYDKFPINCDFAITDMPHAVNLINLDIQANVQCAYRRGTNLTNTRRRALLLNYSKNFIITKTLAVTVGPTSKLKFDDHELVYGDKVNDLSVIMNSNLE